MQYQLTWKQIKQVSDQSITGGTPINSEYPGPGELPCLAIPCAYRLTEAPPLILPWTLSYRPLTLAAFSLYPFLL